MKQWYYSYAQDVWQNYIHTFVKHASINLSGESLLHVGFLPECADFLQYTHKRMYSLQDDVKAAKNTQNNENYIHLFPSIQNESFDCVLAIHYLDNLSKEQQNSSIQALSRIIKPYGKLILFQFNPNGLWYNFQKLAQFLAIPKYMPAILPLTHHNYHCTSYTNMQNTLAYHDLYVEQAQFAVYDLPFKQRSKLHQNIQSKINKMGQRWWPHCSNIYAFILVKRTAGMHIMPINIDHSEYNQQKLIYGKAFF
jgi:SAM-dependent methyltransferase